MNKEAKLIIYDTFKDLLILKSRDRGLTIMQNRLNRKLERIADKLITEILKDPVNAKATLYEPDIKEAYKEVIPKMIKHSVKSATGKVKMDLKQQPINRNTIDRMTEDRIFQASQKTLARLEGNILPKIKEGVLEGFKLEKTADLLKTEFKGMLDYEMLRISRTETQRTYNESKYEVIKNSAAEGKKWVSSGLSNMRESHALLDGEIVAYDEPFSNGLMYPGDPSGPPEEVINCACTIVPVLKIDQET